MDEEVVVVEEEEEEEVVEEKVVGGGGVGEGWGRCGGGVEVVMLECIAWIQTDKAN